MSCLAMLGAQHPFDPLVGFGNAVSAEAAAALSSFDFSSFMLSPPPLPAAQSTCGGAARVAPSSTMSKPSLKRKRSMRDEVEQPNKSVDLTRQPSQSQNSEDTSEQKRTKLGYHRTSIACGHCRRRKIRCLIQDGERSNRCLNCIRLKRECSFHPVDQSLPTSKSKQKTAKAAAKSTRALSPTSTVAPPKRGLSDSSVYYSNVPSSTVHGFQGFQPPKDVSAEIRKPNHEQYSSLYPPSFEQSWLAPSFQPLGSINEPGPQVPLDYGVNGPNVTWDAVGSPSSQPLHRSPSWNELNHPTVVSSPQSTFSPPAQSFVWTRAPQRSASYPEVNLEKTFLPHSTLLAPAVTSTAPLDYSQLLGSEALMQATTSEAINLQATATMTEPSSLPLPTISVSQSASPFPDQHAWPLYTGPVGEHPDESGHFDEQQFHDTWY